MIKFQVRGTLYVILELSKVSSELPELHAPELPRVVLQSLQSNSTIFKVYSFKK